MVRREAGVVPLGHLPTQGTLPDAWRDVPFAPPLAPTSFGARTYAQQLKVATSPDALLVRVPPLAAGRSYVSLDPDGMRIRWWEVILGDRPTVFSCGIDQLDPTFPGHAPTASARCDASDLPITPLPDGAWLVSFPWKLAPQITSEARLMWSVDGPEDGTWMGGGRALPHRLEGGLALDVTAPNTRLRVNTNTEPWTAELVGPLPRPQPLTWRLLRYGRPVHSGSLDAGQRSFTVPVTDDGMLALQVQAQGQSLVSAVHTRVRPASHTAFVATPLHEGVLTIAYATDRPVRDAAIVLSTPQGVWAQAATTVPRGSGQVRITLPSDAPDLLTVAIDGLVTPTEVQWVR